LEIHFEPESADHAPGTGPIALHATGLLISPRHVLTTGHCLYSRRHPPSEQNESAENEAEFPEILAATSATVSPGRNALARPFGSISISDPRRLRTSALWRVSRATNTEFDFGLITLPTRLPRAVGYWGGPDHAIAPVRSEALRDAMVQTAGYPILGRNAAETQASLPLGIDGESTPWTTLGVVTEVSSNEIFHDMPVRFGQNGSPVWTKKGSQRTLIGILGLNQRMVRVTPRLLKRLRTWMAQDGVRASF
jgi:V8-like Glu-specific endopeptidase